MGLLVILLLVGILFRDLYPTWDQTERSEMHQGRERTLFVLGSYHEDMIKALTEIYANKYQVKVDYVRMPTQDAEAKLIAEKDNISFDVWIGGTVDAHEVLKRDNILVKSQVEEEKLIPDLYRDKDGVWKPQYIEVLSIGINQDRWDAEFANLGIEKPQTLEDLLNPAFKGEIIMPNPETSGTGYTFLASVLAEMGEEKGWQYLADLNNQIGQYTYSGYSPAEKVGLGEYVICLNFLSDQDLVNTSGYPVESYVYDKAGWTVVPVSMTAKKGDRAEAQSFIDFCLSREACEVLVGLGNVLVVREDCFFQEGKYQLSDLRLNHNFNPIMQIKEKERIIKQFLKLMQ